MGHRLVISVVAFLLFHGEDCLAQGDLSDRPVQDLPRPGYEPRHIQLGNTTIAPELAAETILDSNIFATPDMRESDVLFRVAPTVTIRRTTENTGFETNAFAAILRYDENGIENRNTFGVNSALNYRIGRANRINLEGGYQRAFESRTDPESRRNFAVPPAKIDILTGEFGYAYRPGRLGIATSFAVTKTNYLAAEEADRDLTTYRGSVRGIVEVVPRFGLFVEGYGNRRDNRTAVDRSGINRDTDTWGFNVGTEIDFTDQWNGELAVGAFRAKPEDSSLDSFSGLGAQGRLLWRPQIRTAISLEVFRGDVATIRSGATGRIDSRVRLQLDQEVRHNLIFTGGVTFLDTSYRGVQNSGQTTFSQNIRAEYLVSRIVSFSIETSHSRRTSPIPEDEFKRWLTSIGVRLRY